MDADIICKLTPRNDNIYVHISVFGETYPGAVWPGSDVVIGQDMIAGPIILTCLKYDVAAGVTCQHCRPRLLGVLKRLDSDLTTC